MLSVFIIVAPDLVYLLPQKGQDYSLLTILDIINPKRRVGKRFCEETVPHNFHLVTCGIHPDAYVHPAGRSTLYVVPGTDYLSVVPHQDVAGRGGGRRVRVEYLL